MDRIVNLPGGRHGDSQALSNDAAYVLIPWPNLLFNV